MKTLKQGILLFLFLMIFWILLTGFQIQELIIGSVVDLIVTLIFLHKSNLFSEFRLSLKSFLLSLIYIFVFLKELIKSNLDVAFRVLNPKLPIKPGIVRVKTKLKSKLGRIILANSITLTPGTLTVETRDDTFYIHWIDVSAKNIEESTQAIVSKFEKYLEVIFG